MSTESFMSKLRNKAQAARAAIGKIFERKQAARPQLPAVQDTTTYGDEAEAKAKAEGHVSARKLFAGPSYTPPSPSPATLAQRRQKAARRIQRRAA